MKHKYCIYGIGELGKKVVDLILDNNDEVVAIYELTPKLDYYRGIKILALKEINNSHLDYPFVIAVWNPNVDLGALKKDLQILGINNILFAGELTNVYQFEHYIFASRSFIELNRSKIEEVKNNLDDIKSKEVFERLLLLRQNNDFENKLDLDNWQYFPNDINEIKSLDWINQVYLDLGAFNGDTLLDIISKTAGVKYYYGVEPDDLNAELLQNTINKNNIEGEVLRVASGSKTGLINFVQGGGVSSKIADLEMINTKQVPLVRFDDFEFKLKPTIIKMDIEGAEKDTLLGLENFIVKSKPVLMVCLYHKKDDLWEIPLLIKSMRTDYKFYIRQHYPNGLETVLYCF